MIVMGRQKAHGAKLTHTHAFADEAAPSSGAVWKLHCQVSPGYLQHNAPERSAPAHTSVFGLPEIDRHQACLTKAHHASVKDTYIGVAASQCHLCWAHLHENTQQC